MKQLLNSKYKRALSIVYCFSKKEITATCLYVYVFLLINSTISAQFHIAKYTKISIQNPKNVLYSNNQQNNLYSEIEGKGVLILDRSTQLNTSQTSIPNLTIKNSPLVLKGGLAVTGILQLIHSTICGSNANSRITLKSRTHLITDIYSTIRTKNLFLTPYINSIVTQYKMQLTTDVLPKTTTNYATIPTRKQAIKGNKTPLYQPPCIFLKSPPPKHII